MKIGSSKDRRKKVRHTPLARQIEQDSAIKKRRRVGKLAQEKDDITEEEYVSNKLSKKILEQAREQAEEEEEEVEIGSEEEEEEVEEVTKKPAAAAAGKGKGQQQTFKSFEELMAEDDDESTFSEISETESQYQDDMTVNEEDERALAMFMNPSGPKRLLSDIIMEKIQAHEAHLQRKEQNKDTKPKEPEIKPEIYSVYVKVGELMRYHSSGKLPKAFRILPSLRNWEQLLYLTRPDRWSPVATRMATLLFSRGMSDKLVQRFYYVILLPKIREEIDATKKLGFHYYLSLKKALFRPAAFFRGILLPLAESGDCTLREAVIIGSVLRRVSIPPIHASVAIYKLCQMPYYGATQHLLIILINKKYSLPYKVIDTIYEYFMGFIDDDRKFPGLWHQTLYIFIQRYKGDLTAEQKEGLTRLMKKHYNANYTLESRRELFSMKSREENIAEAAGTGPSVSMDM
jgi:essential nuclear protein 1